MGRRASTWASATRLRWPPLRWRGKRSPKPGEAKPLEPGVGLDQRLAALHAVQGQAEHHVVARRLPRQQRIVLEQQADLGVAERRLDRARQRLLQADHGAQQARLARARRADQADEAALADGEARPLEDRFAAVGDGQITDAAAFSPGDRGVVQPRDAGIGLDQAADDQALLDPLGGVEIDGHRFGIERLAVRQDDLAEFLEIEAGRHLLGEGRAQLVAAHRRAAPSAHRRAPWSRRSSPACAARSPCPRTATPMNSKDPPRWLLASSRSMAFISTRRRPASPG